MLPLWTTVRRTWRSRKRTRRPIRASQFESFFISHFLCFDKRNRSRVYTTILASFNALMQPFLGRRGQKMFRREFLSGSLALAVASGGSPAPAGAEANWPSRPVRIIYPYSAGSVADATERLLAHRLSDVFHQPFIVENR